MILWYSGCGNSRFVAEQLSAKLNDSNMVFISEAARSNTPLQFQNDEILAIRWHMSAWDLPFQSYEQKSNISEASDVPLVALTQAADGLATHLLEAGKEQP